MAACVRVRLRAAMHARVTCSHLRVRDERGRKVVAVDVVLVVVGVLVVGEEVLRHPHEDVEADRVARELPDVVDARVR